MVGCSVLLVNCADPDLQVACCSLDVSMLWASQTLSRCKKMWASSCWGLVFHERFALKNWRNYALCLGIIFCIWWVGLAERVSTRVVVVVVVVVVQPDKSTYACVHVTSVTEPKSHSLLPKHLPLHTRKSHLRRFIQRQTLQFSL